MNRVSWQKYTAPAKEQEVCKLRRRIPERVGRATTERSNATPVDVYTTVYTLGRLSSLILNASESSASILRFSSFVPLFRISSIRSARSSNTRSTISKLPNHVSGTANERRHAVDGRHGSQSELWEWAGFVLAQQRRCFLRNDAP